MSPRPTVDHAGRFRRVANMAAWLAEVAESTVQELAERFEVSEAQVRQDLEVLMSVTYGADEEALVHASVDESGDVVFWDRDVFVRQLQLRPSEALAVIAAAGALAWDDDEGTSYLSSALRKVRAAVDEASSLVFVERQPLEHLGAVRRSAEAGETITLRYYSLSRDAVTTRDLDPYVVYMLGGQWYVRGHDHLRGETRNFRVDGIIELQPTGRTFERPDIDVPETAYTPGESTRQVRLRLPASGRWVLEALSVVDVVRADADGFLEVEIPVSGDAWLAQLLVRLGPDAEVVEPASLRDLGRDLAEQLLTMYAD